MIKSNPKHSDPRSNKHRAKNSTSKREGGTATLTLEALEPRILLSGTWVDADTGATQSDADSGNDSYTGSSENDTAHGLSGNDVLSGLAGDDGLFGGDGTDILDGGAGNDVLKGQDGNDTLLGADGVDTLKGGSGDDSLDGGTDNDKLSGGTGADTLAGGEGNDILQGGSGNDRLEGGMGNDRLQGGKGDDSMLAGEGQDILNGDAGNDTLDGGAGDDVLKGGQDNDTLIGGAGADRLHGGAGTDALDGGEGDDTLQGGTGDDVLLGGAGNDTLKGGKGADTLDGGAGDDTLLGGAGNDVLLASGGNDTLKGESGDDTFDFTHAQTGDVYTVRGGAGTDTIDLSAHNASQVQQSNGRIDVSLNSGGAFTIHHHNIENIRIGGAVANLNSPTADDGLDSDDSVDDNGSDFNDEAPFADAGTDVSATPGGSVTLDAGQSSAWEPDATLTYTWTQIDGPIVALSGATSAQPTFDAPDVATPTALTFEVHVSDGATFSTDTVTVTVEPSQQPDLDDAPTADAGADQTVEEGATVQLAGNATDPEGQGLTYQWVQTGGPAVTLSDPVAANPTFVAPNGVSNSAVTFELRASDGTNTSVDSVTVTVNADNDAPAANAGADQTVNEGATVQLAGSATDPEDQGLTYQWVQTGGPAVTLSNPTAANPTFTAPEGVSNGGLTFELRASDGTNTSVDTVLVNVLGSSEPEQVPAPQSAPDWGSAPAEQPSPVAESVQANTVPSHAQSPAAPRSEAPIEEEEPGSLADPIALVSPQDSAEPSNGVPAIPLAPIDDANVVDPGSGASDSTGQQSGAGVSPLNPPTIVEQNGPQNTMSGGGSPATTQYPAVPTVVWDGHENLGVMSPTEDLRGAVEYSGFAQDDPTSDWDQATAHGRADAESAFAVEREFEMVDAVPAARPVSELVPAASAHLRLGDVFEEFDPNGSNSAALRGAQEDSDPNDGERSQSREVSTPHVRRARPDREAPWNMPSDTAFTRHAGDLEVASVAGSAMNDESESLFARLWSAVRGLGGTWWRNAGSAAPQDSQAKRG